MNALAHIKRTDLAPPEPYSTIIGLLHYQDTDQDTQQAYDEWISIGEVVYENGKYYALCKEWDPGDVLSLSGTYEYIEIATPEYYLDVDELIKSL